jgi:hypothetical protein
MPYKVAFYDFEVLEYIRSTCTVGPSVCKIMNKYINTGALQIR